MVKRSIYLKNLPGVQEKTIDKPPGCEAVHINMVIRHGSRYPSKSRVQRMKKVLNKINPFFQHGNASSNEAFRYNELSLPWSFPFDIENSASKELSSLGSQEMYSIAKRFLAKFPDVLKHGYSNINYSFVSTDKLRSSQSAVAFAQGIFEGRGDLGSGNYLPVAVRFSGAYDDDIVLRIFEACRKWQRDKAKGNPEYKKFLNGIEMRKVVHNITLRLNLTNKVKFRSADITNMFWTCAFGAQTDSMDTSWCSLFEEEDLKVLEYLHDIKLYWERSYGRKRNYMMGCALYKEITNTFERFIRYGKPHGIFRFAHTGTVLPLLTMLGLYNDSVPPRADNFDQQSKRKFRFSDIVPMSANVAFVLYNCKAKNKSDGGVTGKHNPDKAMFNESDIKIQLLVNEVAVPMPPCGGKTYCSIQRFLSYYSHYKSNCKIRAICGKRRKCKKGRRKRPTD